MDLALSTLSGYVLIVDDNRSVSEPLADVLVEEGYMAICLDNGRDALNYLRTAPSLPSLILLDLMMPIMDGWTFRSTQLSDPKLNPIPIAVMTAGVEFMYVDQVAHMDAVAFLAKPLDVNRVLAIVDRYCSADEMNA